MPRRIFWHERVMHLKPIAIFTAGRSPALAYARQELNQYLTDDPTEATHLLLPAPSFESDGNIKGGYDLEEILESLPEHVTIIGGNLDHPALTEHKKIDLLQDPFYTAQNAAITAHCALGLILTSLPTILPDLKILIIGAGRIGKCLAHILKDLGAQVSLAARKAEDRAMAGSLGFHSVAPGSWSVSQYRVIVNTVPAPLLADVDCAADALLLDLASVRGISGDRVRWARGLPGICAPETSGRLIARRAMELISQKEDAL